MDKVCKCLSGASSTKMLLFIVMKLSKRLKKMTTFSKMSAVILFILLLILGLSLDMTYEKKPNTETFGDASQNSSDPLRFTSYESQYYLDYPSSYSYSYNENEDAVSDVIFIKNIAKEPHRIENYINIIHGFSRQLTIEMVDDLHKMSIGDRKVVAVDSSNTLMNQFNVYERLPDTYIDQREFAVFVNSKPFEALPGSKFYLYLDKNKDSFIIQALTNESTDSLDNISNGEFIDIISTLRFLD